MGVWPLAGTHPGRRSRAHSSRGPVDGNRGGTGLVVLFFGLGILASEILLTARFMDWAEVRVRKLFRRV